MIPFDVALGERVARPLIDVLIAPKGVIFQQCLVDSGALGVRLSAPLARAAEVVLPNEPTGHDILVDGVRTQRFEIEHELAIELGGETVRWMAPVTFCDPWPHPFGLLGLRGFFDVFDVVVEGARQRFTVRPPGASGRPAGAGR